MNAASIKRALDAAILDTTLSFDEICTVRDRLTQAALDADCWTDAIVDRVIALQARETRQGLREGLTVGL
jgi:hypothetical protein